jgi:hypothetical protein
VPSYRRGRLTSRLVSDAEIVALYASGLDADTIGYRAGCCGTTVLAIVRASGGTVRSPGAGRDKPLKLSAEVIVRRYLAGESGPMIADAAGCVASTVYRVLRRHGVTLRDTGPRTAAQAAAHARKTKANMIARRRESRERADADE